MYRCHNCLYFPMEEKTSHTFICPNCNYHYTESPEQHFIRHIYENIEDKNPEDLLPRNTESFQNELRDNDNEPIDVTNKIQSIIDNHNKEVINDTHRHP